MSGQISSETSALLLEKLCSALVSAPTPNRPERRSMESSISPLLASLIRTACAIDLAASRRETSTQTESCRVKKAKSHQSLFSSLSRHREEREPARHEKKRKRKKEGSRPRKRKKEKRKKVHYCSSPSYSDFEPEDPILRRRLRWETIFTVLSFDQ